MAGMDRLRGMLQAYEATPQPIVILAGRRREGLRLLTIVLEGFGYQAMECDSEDGLKSTLAKASPDLALVDAGLQDVESFCASILELGTCPLLLLVEQESVEDGEVLQADLGADAWQSIDAEPDLILRAMRILLEDKAT